MKFTFCFLILFSLFSCKKGLEPSSESSQLFFNGDIITMENDSIQYVEAVVEQNGKIVFTGKKADAEAKFKNARPNDLKGATMLPGFIDPHSHFSMVSNTMGQVDLNPEPVGKIRNIAEVLQNLIEFKEKNEIPDGEWIFGWGYDDGQLAEKRHPTKADIDKVLPNNPVYLQHTSGHMGVANSLGLKKLNYDATTVNPEGGNIERLPNSQEPSGLVQETAMYPFVRNMLETLASKQGEYFETTQNYYASNGITTAQDGMTDRSGIKFFQSQAFQGNLDIDLVALAGYSDLETNLADTSMHFKTYNNGFKVQGTKIVADGSPQGKTAFFSKPFLTSVPGCHHDCRGLPSLTQDEINKLFETAYAKDNQLFIHCNGDATIDMILQAHKLACEKLNQPLDNDRRTIIIHAQFARPDQLKMFVKYNMQPSFFTNHAYFWGDIHVENLGKARADFLSPMVSARTLGLKPTNHSDATVTPISPIFTVWTAVNRLSRSGIVVGEKERATPYLALQAITSFAAYEIFEEHLKGTLTVGKLADFVILDKNPLKIQAIDIKNIEVVETIKEGKSIYRK